MKSRDALEDTCMWDLRDKKVTNLDNGKDGGEKNVHRVGACDEEEDGLHSDHIELDITLIRHPREASYQSRQCVRQPRGGTSFRMNGCISTSTVR